MILSGHVITRGAARLERVYTFELRGSPGEEVLPSVCITGSRRSSNVNISDFDG
jgi:hypothetical protein